MRGKLKYVLFTALVTPFPPGYLQRHLFSPKDSARAFTFKLLDLLTDLVAAGDFQATLTILQIIQASERVDGRVRDQFSKYSVKVAARVQAEE